MINIWIMKKLLTTEKQNHDDNFDGVVTLYDFQTEIIKI